MLKKLLCLSLGFLLFQSFCNAQVVKNSGLPYIKNFFYEDFNGTEQTWAICQDDNGVFYFANGLSVIEYDGHTWNPIKMTGASVVRSLCNGNDGRIYAGLLGDIGFIQADANGVNKYYSLVNKIPENERVFTDVWRVYKIDTRILFCTYAKIFIFENDTIRIIKPDTSFMRFYHVNNKFYIVERNKGILTLENDKLVPIPNGEIFVQNRGLVILPYDANKLLIYTRDLGFTLYDGTNCTPWKTQIDDFLKKSGIYHAIPVGNNYFALASISLGFVIIDKTGKAIQYLNKEKGLLSDEVYHLYVDNQSNLWACTNNGISYIEINSPFTYFNESYKYEANCYASILYDNKLYAGGSPNIYYRDWKDYENPFELNYFKKLESTTPQTFHLACINGKLLAAHNPNVLQIYRNETKIITIKNDYYYMIVPLTNKPTYAIATQSDGLYVIQQEGNTWKYRFKIAGYSEDARDLTIDKESKLWIASNENTVYRLTLNENSDSVINKETFSFLKPGSSPVINKKINVINDRLIFSAYDGFYFFNYLTNKFEPYKPFNDLIEKGKPVNILSCNEQGNVFFGDEEGLGMFIYLGNDTYSVVRQPFMKLKKQKAFYPNFIINDSNAIMGQPKLLIHYKQNYTKDYNQPFKTLIRKVELIKNDSVIYGGNFSPKKAETVILPFKDNSIRFNYTSNYYENTEKIDFQYKLEGLDEGWSRWTADLKKEYTNLFEGSYTFKVRSRNVFKTKGEEMAFKFKVLPPWYRSWFAVSGYFILLAALIFGIVKLNLMRLQKEKEHLESIVAERTIEVKNKNDELELRYQQIQNQKNEIQNQLGIIVAKHREVAAKNIEIGAKNRELVELNADKDRFMSILAHDLTSPFSAFLGLSELLSESIHIFTIDEIEDIVNQIYTSAQRTYSLLKNLLTWTRSKSGRIPFEPEDLDFSSICLPVIETLLPNSSSKKITINYSEEEEAIVFADNNMLKTVLLNLISNAIKFTFDCGRINIYTRKTDSGFRVTISDNGTGMSAETLTKIFDNSQIFTTKGTSDENGTGLGLLLCKDFIEKHGGRIWAESEVGNGSNFIFTLPYRK